MLKMRAVSSTGQTAYAKLFLLSHLRYLQKVVPADSARCKETEKSLLI